MSVLDPRHRDMLILQAELRVLFERLMPEWRNQDIRIERLMNPLGGDDVHIRVRLTDEITLKPIQ